jgi:hypothetical protein
MRFVDKKSQAEEEEGDKSPSTPKISVLCEVLNEDSQCCGFECEAVAAAPDRQQWDMRPVSIMTMHESASEKSSDSSVIRKIETHTSTANTAWSITSDDESNSPSISRSSCCQTSSGWGNGHELNFASVLLFFLGSAFYVWLAVFEYLWVKNLQPIPIDVLTSFDDNATWYTTMTADYDGTYDDDNLLQIGTTEYQITKYQFIYFIASFCFALAGLLDIIDERRWYNLFRLFGGLFGMVSAIVLSVNELASSVTNAISVHLYLFDAICILWRYCMLTGTTNMLTSISITIVIIIGLVSYLLGTLSDVVVSYNDDALSSLFF